MKVGIPFISLAIFPTITDAFSTFLVRYQATRGTRYTSLQNQESSLTRLMASAEGNSDESKNTAQSKKPESPKPLDPVVAALDPKYKCTEPVGQGDFTVTRAGGPSKEELSNENLYNILMLKCTDLEVNTVVWKCLGYRFDEEAEEWTNAEVFPKWKEMYPEPPDFIGMARIYSRDVDKPSLQSNQALVKSVPTDFKQFLKVHLKPLGFTGYQVGLFYFCDDVGAIYSAQNCN